MSGIDLILGIVVTHLATASGAALTAPSRAITMRGIDHIVSGFQSNRVESKRRGVIDHIKTDLISIYRPTELTSFIASNALKLLEVLSSATKNGATRFWA
jgi:hypothetical protein